MPFWSVQFRSSLPVTAVVARLRGMVEATQPPGLWDALEGGLGPHAIESTFRGEVSGRTFRMIRVIGHRKSFLPVIRGVVTADVEGGTTVRLRMTLPIGDGVFLTVWLGSLAWQSLRDPAGTPALVPLGMMLFGVLISCFGFFPEAWKAESLIREAVMPEHTQGEGTPS